MVLTITREGNSLMAQPEGGRSVEILPSSESKFFATTPAVTITFVKGTDGKVTHMLFTQSGKELQGKKIE